jgi:hypothetical protein
MVEPADQQNVQVSVVVVVQESCAATHDLKDVWLSVGATALHVTKTGDSRFLRDVHERRRSGDRRFKRKPPYGGEAASGNGDWKSDGAHIALVVLPLDILVAGVGAFEVQAAE